MAENNSTSSDQGSSNVPAGKRRRGWWWKTPLGLVVLLILLVVFAPAILSTSPLRNFILGRVNNSLNGSVQADDWSISWTRGVDVRGLKVYDQDNNLVLTADVHTPMSLLAAARGNIDLGETKLDVDFKRLTIDKQGNTNLQKLVKTGPAQPAKPSGPAVAQPAAAAQPSQLPNVTGKITIKYRGNVQGEALPAPVTIEPSQIVLNIPDINKTITNAINLTYRVGSGPVSSVSLAGGVDVVENRRIVPVKAMVVDQKLELNNVDLGVASPLMKVAKVNAQVAGVANGAVRLNMAGIGKLTAEGGIKVANFLLGGDVLKGDVFKSKLVELPVNVSRQTAEGVTVLAIDRLGVQFDQGRIMLSGKAPRRR